MNISQVKRMQVPIIHELINVTREVEKEWNEFTKLNC